MILPAVEPTGGRECLLDMHHVKGYTIRDKAAKARWGFTVSARTGREWLERAWPRLTNAMPWNILLAHFERR